MCERERERESMCVRNSVCVGGGRKKRSKEIACVSVGGRECVCGNEREIESVCECVCVCECEKEGQKSMSSKVMEL